MNRRELLRCLAAGGAAAWFGSGRWSAAAESAGAKNPALSFGIISDVQYQDIPPQNKRSYRDSLKKLEQCVEEFRGLKPDFIIQLGDLINGEFASYDAVLPICDKLPSPLYHVLGNHDLAVETENKAKVLARLGPDRLGEGKGWYDFTRAGWRFVVLNGNDISLAAPGAEERKAAEAMLADLRKRKAENATVWNGAVGPRQLEWLKKTLASAAAAGEKAIVFCHFPLLPGGNSTLWNAAEVIAALDAGTCVVAYISGHVHSGDYVENGGIHYLTVKGMVENDPTAFALMEVLPDSLRETGFGREPGRTLKFAT
jgi:3',5'-cyclic AMP phosphodiesterase CpdA